MLFVPRNTLNLMERDILQRLDIQLAYTNPEKKILKRPMLVHQAMSDSEIPNPIWIYSIKTIQLWRRLRDNSTSPPDPSEPGAKTNPKGTTAKRTAVLNRASRTNNRSSRTFKRPDIHQQTAQPTKKINTMQRKCASPINLHNSNVNQREQRSHKQN